MDVVLGLILYTKVMRTCGGGAGSQAVSVHSRYACGSNNDIVNASN